MIYDRLSTFNTIYVVCTGSGVLATDVDLDAMCVTYRYYGPIQDQPSTGSRVRVPSGIYE